MLLRDKVEVFRTSELGWTGGQDSFITPYTALASSHDYDGGAAWHILELLAEP